jgi:biopolymer transport protein ExbB
MEVYSMVSFFQKGGLFMYPILLVFLAGMAITTERWLQLKRTRSVNRNMWNVLYPVLAKGEFDKASAIIAKDRSVISQMLGTGLARLGKARRREDIEIAMEESMMDANANPAEKADLLSASISVAMNTTAFGLMSAIPLLLFHAKLTSTTGQIVDSLEMASVKVLNTISDFNRRHFEKEPELQH